MLRPGGVFLASIRDYGPTLEERPAGNLPRLMAGPDGERLVFQVWDWHEENRYTVRHFLLTERAGGGWVVAERTMVYRALTGPVLTAALEQAGLEEVAWSAPEASGYYQPVVSARAPRLTAPPSRR